MKGGGLSTFLYSISREDVKDLTKYEVIDLIRFTPNGFSLAELTKQYNL
jgi:hypothetical protein